MLAAEFAQDFRQDLCAHDIGGRNSHRAAQYLQIRTGRALQRRRCGLHGLGMRA
jgi:hypothetical protein